MMLSPKAAAEILGVTESTVREYAREGLVPATKIGKNWLFPADLADYLDEQCFTNALPGRWESD